MEEEKKVAQPKSRREFIATTAKIAVTAPAVATLLAASVKQAAAQYAPLDTQTGVIDHNSIGLDN